VSKIVFDFDDLTLDWQCLRSKGN